MNNKSILFCTGIFPPEIGGPATYVFKMAQKMSTDGIKNSIITYSDRNNFDDYGLDVHRVERKNFLYNYTKYFLKVLKIGKNFDILYIQGSFSEGIPTILASFFLRKKTIIRIGGIFSWEISFHNRWTTDLADDFLTKKQKFIPEILKIIDRLVISQCSNIITNSLYTKKLLVLNGIKNKQIEVIYNSFDNPDFEVIDKEACKKELGVENKKIILSIGRFVPWKNFDKLIEFSRNLSDDFVIFIAGEGTEKEHLEKMMLAYALDKKVFILNKLSKPELYKMYQVVDIFVLLSSFEGLSHVLIEAMAMNLPIISSNIDPNLEALDGYNKYKCININEDEFLCAIDFFKKNKTPKASNTLNKYNLENIYIKTLKILCEY
jgi:glycosyltransferase involved in cell wall biosynthesis